MTVKLDEMTLKQLRKHAREVAKALVRKEAARAKKLRKKVVNYTKELGVNVGEFFDKKDTMENETSSTTAIPEKAENAKPPKYIEPDGTPRQRLGKWSEKYTKQQIESMKQK